MISGYASAWQTRADRRAARDAAWRDDVLGRLPAVLARLRDHFGVRRAVLFGSFARGEARPGSDLDLLVEGLAVAKLIDATVEAERMLPGLHVDLVPMQLAREAVKQRALEEGVTVHAKP